jgi:hypothetical protein
MNRGLGSFLVGRSGLEERDGRFGRVVISNFDFVALTIKSINHFPCYPIEKSKGKKKRTIDHPDHNSTRPDNARPATLYTRSLDDNG